MKTKQFVEKSIRFWVILVLLFVLHAVGRVAYDIIYLCFFADARMQTSDMLIRTLRARYGIINEAGEFPPSLDALADLDKRVNPGRTHSKWNGIYYVGGLKVSDPPSMPIVIEKSLNPYGKRRVMFVSGRIHFIRDIERSKRKFLTTAPWELVRDEFADEEEYKAFTNRLKLIKTEGLK